MHFLNQHQLLKTHWGGLAYYHRPGIGMPLVFLHGTGCESRDWAATLSHPPGDAHILCLDFQGHGESDVPTDSLTLTDLARDTLQLIDHLGFEGVVLVGHSLGGMVALSAAGDSERVVGLVLLEGWTNLRAARAFGPDRFYGKLSSDLVERIQQAAQHTMDRFAAKAWQSFWESVVQFDGTACLEKARMPVLEVYGEMGRTPESEAQLLVPSNPDIEWVWIPDAGHYLPHEQPAAVAAACARMIDRLDRTGSSS